MNKDLLASIVIPAYNAEDTIHACLSSVMAAISPAHEVIVVDDGSTDGTASIVRSFPCRVISQPMNQGPGAARNRGILSAQAPYVLFTDADCIVQKDWVDTALEEFQAQKIMDNGIVGAAGRILPLKGFFNHCDAYSAYGYNQHTTPGYTDNFCTSNLVVERAAIIFAGLFKEDLPAFEDLEMGLRLLKRGGRLYYQPLQVVRHNHRRLGFRGFLGHEYQWGQSIGNYFEVHYPDYRRTPVTRWMGRASVYGVCAPVFALLITFKIVFKNALHHPAVFIYSPFIFLSKLLFRVGALEYIRRQKHMSLFLSAQRV